MTEEELIEEYLLKFPTILQTALKDNVKYRNAFLRTIETKYEKTKVYRLLHRENEIHEDDFICNLEEAELYGFSYRKVNIGHYGVSVNEDPHVLVKAINLPNVRHTHYGIAEGWMISEKGPADFEGNKPHHNWYLYKDSIRNMKNEFSVVNLEKFMSASIEKEEGKDDKNERGIFLG